MSSAVTGQRNKLPLQGAISIFDDRRTEGERRSADSEQILSLVTYCRRTAERRKSSTTFKPWWLARSYAQEMDVQELLINNLPYPSDR